MCLYVLGFIFQHQCIEKSAFLCYDLFYAIFAPISFFRILSMSGFIFIFSIYFMHLCVLFVAKKVIRRPVVRVRKHSTNGLENRK